MRTRKISKQYKQTEKSPSKGPVPNAELAYIAQGSYEMQINIEAIQTDYYRKICNRLVIPMPEKNDETCYYKYNFDEEDEYILTIIGFQKVRGLIRQEKKERSEIYSFWASIITGIIGTLIGLITIIKM